MALPTLRVRHHAAITAVQPGDVRVSASIGPDGELMALWSTAEDQPALTSTTTRPGWATFPDPRAPRPVTARVTVHAMEPISVTTISGLKLAHVTVQPLPRGRMLVVGARARRRPEGPDRNAIVYDADGRLLAEATLGDGIAHLFTTVTGHVWSATSTKGSTATTDGAKPSLSRHWVRTGWHASPRISNRTGGTHPATIPGERSATATRSTSTATPPGPVTTRAFIVRVREGALTGWGNSVSGPRLSPSTMHVSRCSAATVDTTTGCSWAPSAANTSAPRTSTGLCCRTARPAGTRTSSAAVPICTSFRTTTGIGSAWRTSQPTPATKPTNDPANLRQASEITAAEADVESGSRVLSRRRIQCNSVTSDRSQRREMVGSAAMLRARRRRVSLFLPVSTDLWLRRGQSGFLDCAEEWSPLDPPIGAAGRMAGSSPSGYRTGSRQTDGSRHWRWR